MKAFLWGLGAAAAPLTKPDQKKKKGTECLNDSLTLLLFPSSLSMSKWCFVIQAQFRTSCLRWREKARLQNSVEPRVQVDNSAAATPSQGWPRGRVLGKDVTAHAPSENLNTAF